MAGKNIPTMLMMRLFGVDIAADQPAVYNFRPLASPSPAMASSLGLFLLQERPFQNSDGEGAEVSRAAAADVDTSLGLSCGAEVVVSWTTDDAPVYNPMPSQRFPPMTNPELSLSLGGLSQKMPFQESDGEGFKNLMVRISRGSSPALSKITDEKVEKSNVVTEKKGGVAVPRMADYAPVYSPMPLRCFPANPDLSLSLGGWSSFFPPKMPFGECGGRAVNISATDQADGKRKRKQKDVVTDGKKGNPVKRVRRSNPVDDQKLETIPSLEEIPGILQKIEAHNGTTPVFLYRKRLQVSDVKPDQNRLFMTKCGQVLKFLTEEEKRIVANSRAGLEVSAVDPPGKSYKLHLATWPSLNMVVLNTDWRRLVHGNNVQEGYFVELWGYRQNGKLCFATNFRKPEAAETQTGAGSSGSTNRGTVTA